MRLCPGTYVHVRKCVWPGRRYFIPYTHLRPRVCTCTLRRTSRQVSWPDSFRCIWPLINSHRSVWSKFCQCTENADVHALRNCKQNFKGNLGSLMMDSLYLSYFPILYRWTDSTANSWYLIFVKSTIRALMIDINYNLFILIYMI